MESVRAECFSLNILTTKWTGSYFVNGLNGMWLPGDSSGLYISCISLLCVRWAAAVKVSSRRCVKCGVLWSGTRMFTALRFYHSLVSLSFFSQAGVWHFNSGRCWIPSVLTAQITCWLYMSHRPSDTLWLKQGLQMFSSLSVLTELQNY